MDKETAKAINTLSNKINDIQRVLDNHLQILHSESTEKIQLNANDIADNRDGIMETFETSMTNTDDISTLRDGLMEVYEMLVESEV